MSYSGRYRSSSRSPYRRGRSLSRSRSRSWSRDSSVENPGNNLYVTGLSPRLTKEELEKHFASEGKVTDIHLVVDPWTRESRGFGFVTMATLEDADRCIKYLDGSVLEGRVITIEKARRRRGRTPTPGRYLGLRTVNARRRSPSYSPLYRGRYDSPCYSSERDRSYSPYHRRHRSRSSSYYRRHRSRSYSPYYWRHRSRSYAPYYYRRHRSRSYSPYYYRRHRSRSYSPYYYRRHRSRSYSPYYYRRHISRSYNGSPYDCRYSRSPIRGHHRSYSRDSRLYSTSRSVSPYDRSVSPVRSRRLRRSYSRSVSPEVRRRNYSKRSPSPRSYSRSYSPVESEISDRTSSCSPSPHESPAQSKRRYSRESYSHSRSGGSRSISTSARS